MSFGLKTDQEKKIIEALKCHPKVNKAVVFGSRAKNTHRPGSDIDMVLFGEHISHKDLLRIKKDLSELNLPYKFDPVIYSEISEPALKDHIDRVGIVFIEHEQKLS